MKVAWLFALLPLAACSGTPKPAPEPVIVTQRVEVPVSVPCVVHMPIPEYVDTDAALAAAPDIFALVKLLLAGREQRAQIDREQAAAASGCASN